jgi:hypothetical protein
MDYYVYMNAVGFLLDRWFHIEGMGQRRMPDTNAYAVDIDARVDMG